MFQGTLMLETKFWSGRPLLISHIDTFAIRHPTQLDSTLHSISTFSSSRIRIFSWKRGQFEQNRSTCHEITPTIPKWLQFQNAELDAWIDGANQAFVPLKSWTIFNPHIFWHLLPWRLCARFFCEVKISLLENELCFLPIFIFKLRQVTHVSLSCGKHKKRVVTFELVFQRQQQKNTVFEKCCYIGLILSWAKIVRL